MSDVNEASHLDLRQIVRVLGRRRWLLVLPWAGALAVGLALAFLLPPVYYSSVTMVIQQPQMLTQQMGDLVHTGPTADQQADLMRQQVQSTLFLHQVITAAGLDRDAALRASILAHATLPPGVTPETHVLDVLTQRLRDNISVLRDKGDVIKIMAGDGSPARAQRIAAAVADQFVQSTRTTQLGITRATQRFSLEQQQVYKRQLDEAEDRLRAEEARQAPTQLPTDAAAVQGEATKATGLSQQAGTEVEDQRDKVATLRRQLGAAAALAGRLSSPRVQELGAQIVSLERQLSAAMMTDGADNGSSARILISRKFGELESELQQNAGSLTQLTADQRDLLVRYRLAEADLAAREAGLAYFTGRSATVRRAVAQAPGSSVTLDRLRQEVDNARSLYNSFVQQAAAAQISEAYENTPASTQFVILEPATWPPGAGKPNRPVLILLAFVLGGMLGVGTVLVVEQHDESMRDAEEVENLLGLPVLGAVPRVEELERSRRRRGGAAKDPNARDQAGLLQRLRVESAIGLEFRRIFLKLARTRGRSLPRTMLVTSATRGEGKTTTAASLAITLARELHERVLLVDFDLRSPSLHRALGLPSSSWGVAQMLGQHTFDERFVRTTSVPGLDFLPAGKSERPAGELVDIGTVEWFLQEAARRYATVVVDAAPNLAVPDSLIIGRAVEGVLYVIKAGSTVRKAAEYGVKVQRDARDNVIGVLMNDVGEVLPSYYGYRTETYGYSTEAAGGEP
ncbi:MAG TPA: Wzz/FepE/Etk N-terminal domain-containing protein [Candidatus Eisenbacteria bacterium]|nr:Wzz/FepE/Etk N-terminal domain-containing protein [Candidatus Eisenbacteria bacterium]